MNPKLPSHVIQSRKYLLKVHCVLDTGNTKINKMQWKFQFAGETSRQFCFMSSDLQYRDVHIVETKWRNIEGSGNAETYITICKVDNQGKFAVWLRKLNRGSVST